MISEVEQLVGKIYEFSDGASIHVFQVKRRDDGLWVTYEVIFPGCLAKRHIMAERDFIEKFSHLFV